MIIIIISIIIVIVVTIFIIIAIFIISTKSIVHSFHSVLTSRGPWFVFQVLRTFCCLRWLLRSLCQGLGKQRWHEPCRSWSPSLWSLEPDFLGMKHGSKPQKDSHDVGCWHLLYQTKASWHILKKHRWRNPRDDKSTGLLQLGSATPTLEFTDKWRCGDGDMGTTYETCRDLNSAVWTLKSPFKRAVTAILEEFVVLIWWTTCTHVTKMCVYVGINIRDLHCFFKQYIVEKKLAAAFSWYAPKQQYVLQCNLL